MNETITISKDAYQTLIEECRTNLTSVLGCKTEHLRSVGNLSNVYLWLKFASPFASHIFHDAIISALQEGPSVETAVSLLQEINEREMRCMRTHGQAGLAVH